MKEVEKECLGIYAETYNIYTFLSWFWNSSRKY